MSDTKRRTFLQGSLATGAAGAAWAVGLLTPESILADWPTTAFASKETQEAIKDLYGTEVTENHPSIHIKAPEIAENGAVVPIVVQTTLTDVTQIAIFAAVNPFPLAADFQFSGGVLPFVSTRIKMSKTGDVVVVIKSAGKLYSARKEVKVTIGGCGG